MATLHEGEGEKAAVWGNAYHSALGVSGQWLVLPLSKGGQLGRDRSWVTDRLKIMVLVLSHKLS